MSEYSEKFAAAVAFLKSNKADSIEHSDGNLLDHFAGTARLLEEWGNRPDLCLAGLCHAVYGTEGFQQSILEPSERDQLRVIIGEAAEAIVYFYGSAERNSFCPSINRGVVTFRDRFTGEKFEPDANMLRDCLELMLANDVEIAARMRQFRTYTQPYNTELFTRCRDYVSEAGFESMCEVYGPDHAAAG
jgi:hypothetical protein